jgi:hypothetical protein
MIARRTDGSEFPVEVTSANLENGQQAYDGYGYTSDELLMLVVRDSPAPSTPRPSSPVRSGRPR